MNKIAKVLGTVKHDHESWRELFLRAEQGGGIDNKTIIAVLVEILEELDNVKGKIKRETTVTIPRESTTLSSGTGEVKEEISNTANN